MEGKNVKMLMPSFFAQRHDGYLRRYVATGAWCRGGGYLRRYVATGAGSCGGGDGCLCRQ